jgi:hypothetical protein
MASRKRTLLKVIILGDSGYVPRDLISDKEISNAPNDA